MFTYKKLINFFKQLSIFDEISSILEWDMATLMPLKSRSSRIKQIKVLIQRKNEIFNEIKKLNLFKKINPSKLKKFEKRNFNLMQKEFDIFSNIPSKLMLRNQKLSVECEGKWREAKKKNNFNIVKKDLTNLFKSIKEKAKILSDLWGISEYDALLSLYDQSFDSEDITKFTTEIESFIKTNYGQFIKNYKQKKILDFDSFLSEKEQFELSKFVMNKFNFNFNKGRVDTSLHPFCGGFSDDIRITTRFNKKDFFQALML